MEVITLPYDRPVMGSDIITLKEEWHLTVTEMQIILGITNSAWMEITHNQLRPIKNTPVAVLARFYAAHPELLPINNDGSITEKLKEVVGKFRPDTWKTDVSNLLGRDGKSSYYRWFRYNRSLTPPAARLGNIILDNVSVNSDPKEAEEFLSMIENLVESERAAYKKATTD